MPKFRKCVPFESNNIHYRAVFLKVSSFHTQVILFPTQNEGEGAQLITREYSLYCHGRFISQATGEHTFYSKSNLSYGKACESAKSNALTRCCKDLGIASELWDPQVCHVFVMCLFYCLTLRHNSFFREKIIRVWDFLDLLQWNLL